MTNPLLEEHLLPPFSTINTDHMTPAVSARIDHVFAVLKQQLALLEQGESPTWDNLVAPLEEAYDLLSQSWSPISHLNGVCNNDALRDVYNQCLQQLTEFSTTIDQHFPLYTAYNALANSAYFQQLDTAQQKVVNDALADFRLAGVALPDAQKARYGEIKKRLSSLSNDFSNHVLDATQGWYLQVHDVQALSGLPESALASAQQAAAQKSLEGYVITLDFPSYLAVMTYAEDRQLREQVYRAFATRASALGVLHDGESAAHWDNSALIDETLALRHELAELLGFSNYSELSLAKKMAKDPAQVIQFLEELAEKSLPVARNDFAELEHYARSHHNLEQLAAWDITFYSEKLRQQKYDISQEALRAYFPAPRVIAGMFEVVHRLYGIVITPVDDVDLWHNDVSFYQIEKDGNVIAYFYLDMYARDKKRGGAWMADCRTRRQRPSGELQLPVAYLTCNFTPPVDDKPSLLTHNEVTTLFHEFGHGLHHMLTQMTAAAVSGISGVAWDAVELPSQFLENWCWEKTVIPMISGHYETGEPLPEAMLDKMLAAKNFQSGMQMVRQLEFSLFDMRLHSEYNTHQSRSPQTLIDEIRAAVAVVIPPQYNRFQNSFSHIFAGGYAAGYYSYKWAEVLSADAFSLFEENGIFDQPTGQRFLQTILAQGGSKEPMALFVEFRGREPKTDALLRHSGITG